MKFAPPDITRPSCTALAESTSTRSKSMHIVVVDPEGEIHCNCPHTERIDGWKVLGADDLEGYYAPSLCATCATYLSEVPGISHDDLMGLRGSCGDAYPDDPVAQAQADADAQARIIANYDGGER